MHKCIAYVKELLTPSSSVESIFNNSYENIVKIKKIHISSKDDLVIAEDTDYNVELDSVVLQSMSPRSYLICWRQLY